MHTKCKEQTSRFSDCGSALVLVLLVTLVVVGMGMTALWIGSSGTKISSSLTRRQEALYAAQSGVERARQVLSLSSDISTVLAAQSCTATSDDPVVRGNILCENTVPIERIPVIEGSTDTAAAVSAAMCEAQYTVFVRNDDEWRWCNGVVDDGESSDDANCDGNPGPENDLWRATNDQNRLLIVRSEGLGGDGLSCAAIEVVAAQRPGQVENPEYSQEGGNARGSNSSTISMQ